MEQLVDADRPPIRTILYGEPAAHHQLPLRPIEMVVDEEFAREEDEADAQARMDDQEDRTRPQHMQPGVEQTASMPIRDLVLQLVRRLQRVVEYKVLDLQQEQDGQHRLDCWRQPSLPRLVGKLAGHDLLRL